LGSISRGNGTKTDPLAAIRVTFDDIAVFGLVAACIPDLAASQAVKLKNTLLGNGKSNQLHPAPPIPGRAMSTLSLFSAGNNSVPGGTSWYLADLGEFRGKQELYTHQSLTGRK